MIFWMSFFVLNGLALIINVLLHQKYHNKGFLALAFAFGLGAAFCLAMV